MKKLLVLLFSIFFLSSLSVFAEDISDFEIEGMSIGDSLLDYFSLKEIKQREISAYHYKDDTFIIIDFEKPQFSQYELVQFTYKPNDKNYKIYGIEGLIFSIENINECLINKDKIVNELSIFFGNNVEKVDYGKVTHGADITGNSYATTVYFNFDSGGFIDVACYDWSAELTKENAWFDNLRVSMISQEFDIFLEGDPF